MSNSRQNQEVEPYCGRFAPSPTGPLHFGSLLAAVASYLQARKMDGHWLVRMEDLDRPREVPGAADDILQTLETFGFQWDGPVIYQSQRSEAYQHALDQLHQQDVVYSCQCSRKQIKEQMLNAGLSVYPGTCRSRPYSPRDQQAVRIRVDSLCIQFNDRIHGDYAQDISQAVGDFIVRRADQLFAYQLAVVVDDDFQHITEVVRGCDLLDNTPRQIYLMQKLGMTVPRYVHIPLATNDKGEKLSKQTCALPLNPGQPTKALYRALDFLGQEPLADLQHSTVDECWTWARQHWNLDKIPKFHSMFYSETADG